MVPGCPDLIFNINLPTIIIPQVVFLSVKNSTSHSDRRASKKKKCFFLNLSENWKTSWETNRLIITNAYWWHIMYRQWNNINIASHKRTCEYGDGNFEISGHVLGEIDKPPRPRRGRGGVNLAAAARWIFWCVSVAPHVRMYHCYVFLYRVHTGVGHPVVVITLSRGQGRRSTGGEGHFVQNFSGRFRPTRMCASTRAENETFSRVVSSMWLC